MTSNNSSTSKESYKTLKFDMTLFYFEEPILMLYKAGKSYYIASAMPSDEGYVETYLAVPVTPSNLKKYFRQECDLRFLFLEAKADTLLKFSAVYAEKPDVRATLYGHELTDEFLPEPQFFASSHTQLHPLFQKMNGVSETLFIDGNWEMEDFGTLSSRYRDIYTFEKSIIKLSDPQISDSDKKGIKAVLGGKTLHGGGSYVSLFRELHNVTPANERYDLKKVQYASPGTIEFVGEGNVFSIVEARIKNMLENSGAIYSSYIALYKFMSDAGLLDIQGSSPAVDLAKRNDIKDKTKKLLSLLGVGFFDELMAAVNNDVVMVCKIALALARRIRAASQYFAEGRVVFDR